MSKKPQYAEYDPWATYNPDAPACSMVRVNPKRKRKVTLAGALKQAGKAGVNVAGATIKSDGSFALEFGETPSELLETITINEWDEVLQ